MIEMIEPRARRPHDAYHRFLREGAWTMENLWRPLVEKVVNTFHPDGVIPTDLDDTLFHKSGRKVEGAGTFRDAVRSTTSRVVYALGLNLVVLTIRVNPFWGGEPIGLPVNIRLYKKKRKDGEKNPTHLDLAQDMVKQLAAWLPNRTFSLCCDGAYASLAGRHLPHTAVTSRMRRDAALFNMPPIPKRQKRGRPRKRGRRLPTPEAMARQPLRWIKKTVDFRGRAVTRLFFARPVLWYAVCPDQPVLLVLVRDPGGKEHDDFFFTTKIDDTAAAVASRYSDRWSIEDAFRNTKQFLGGEDPQTWIGEGPQRAAALSFWIYSATWYWYLTTQGTKVTWPLLPWYRSKRTPSFADALAALRRQQWRVIFARSDRTPVPKKTIAVLIDALARAG